MAGRELTEEEVEDVIKDIESDEEARSAVETISDFMSAPARIKYSPATGKRYSADLEFDPETGVKLEYVD